MDLKEEEMRRIGVKRKVFSRLNQQGGDESGVSGRSLKDPVSKQDNPGEMHQGDKAHRKRKAVLDGVVGKDFDCALLTSCVLRSHFFKERASYFPSSLCVICVLQCSLED